MEVIMKNNQSRLPLYMLAILAVSAYDGTPAMAMDPWGPAHAAHDDGGDVIAYCNGCGQEVREQFAVRCILCFSDIHANCRTPDGYCAVCANEEANEARLRRCDSCGQEVMPGDHVNCHTCGQLGHRRCFARGMSMHPFCDTCHVLRISMQAAEQVDLHPWLHGQHNGGDGSPLVDALLHAGAMPAEPPLGALCQWGLAEPAHVKPTASLSHLKLPDPALPPCPFASAERGAHDHPEIAHGMPQPPARVAELVDLLTAEDNKEALQCCVCFDPDDEHTYNANAPEPAIPQGWIICRGKNHNQRLCAECFGHLDQCPLCRATPPDFVWLAEHPDADALRAYKRQLARGERAEQDEARCIQCHVTIPGADADGLCQRCMLCPTCGDQLGDRHDKCRQCLRRSHRECLVRAPSRGRVCKRCHPAAFAPQPAVQEEVRIPLKFHLVDELPAPGNGGRLRIGWIILPNGRNGGDRMPGHAVQHYKTHRVLVAVNPGEEPYYVLGSSRCNYVYVSSEEPTRPLPAGLYQWDYVPLPFQQPILEMYPGARRFRLRREGRRGYFDQDGTHWRAERHLPGRHPFDPRRRPNPGY